MHKDGCLRRHHAASGRPSIAEAEGEQQKRRRWCCAATSSLLHLQIEQDQYLDGIMEWDSGSGILRFLFFSCNFMLKRTSKICLNSFCFCFLQAEFDRLIRVIFLLNEKKKRFSDCLFFRHVNLIKYLFLDRQTFAKKNWYYGSVATRRVRRWSRSRSWERYLHGIAGVRRLISSCNLAGKAVRFKFNF